MDQGSSCETREKKERHMSIFVGEDGKVGLKERDKR